MVENAKGQKLGFARGLEFEGGVWARAQSVVMSGEGWNRKKDILIAVVRVTVG